MDLDHIAAWQAHRRLIERNGLTFDGAHNSVHVSKAHGYLAAMAEHMDHDEDFEQCDPKRAADFLIHAVWLVEICGFDAGKVVAERIASFCDGFDVEHLDENWREMERPPMIRQTEQEPVIITDYTEGRGKTNGTHPDSDE